MMLFSLNQEALKSVNLDKKESQITNEGIFDSFRSTPPTKYLIGTKALYGLEALNGAAEEFIGHSNPENKDILHKFKSISIPRENE